MTTDDNTARQLARIADALEIIASALTGIGMTLDDLDNRDSARGVIVTTPRITHVASDGRRITWHCSTCDEPLRDGWIELRGEQMRLAYDSLRREAEIAIEARAERFGGAVIMYSAAELLDLPSLAHWRATCRTCNGDDQGSGYFIEVDDIATVAAVLDWTAHLSGKVWLEHTDWQDVCRLVAAAATRRAAA